MNDVTLLPCLRCDGEVVLFRADLRRVHSTAGGPEDPAYNWRCKNCNLSNCFPFTGKDGAANAASDANRRAPAVVESASPWQPMESAPKDGTRILIATQGTGIRIGFWVLPQNIPDRAYAAMHWGSEPFWTSGDDWYKMIAGPVKWMPLPATPSNGQEP